MAVYDKVMNVWAIKCFFWVVKGKIMKISYKGLWKQLIDHNMQKKDLIDKVGLSSTTIAKMGKGEKVSLDVIERVCNHLDCNIGDVISFEKEQPK